MSNDEIPEKSDGSRDFLRPRSKSRLKILPPFDSPVQLIGSSQTSLVINPVHAPDVRRLRLISDSIFLPATLAAQIEAGEVLAWHCAGCDEYIITGHWRHRPEIRIIIEMRHGKHADALLSHVLAIFRAESVRLVTLDVFEADRNLSFYRAKGFQKIEDLVQYEVKPLPPPSCFVQTTTREMVMKDVDSVLEVDNSAFPWLWQNSLEELLWYSGLIGVNIFVQEALPEPMQEDEVNKKNQRSGNNHAIVGYAGVTIVGQRGHLDRLAVKKEFQGRGYGEMLLSYVLKRMGAMGVTSVTLSTQANNQRSQDLYRKYGFALTEWANPVYGLAISDSEL